MNGSILTSIKKLLGYNETDTSFDTDILMHINTVFFTFNQIGVGPAKTFMIEDAAAQWSDFLGHDGNFNAVKTCMWLKVRLLFDPPATSHLVDAIKSQISEYEWRLKTEAENRLTTVLVVPVVPDIPVDPAVIDTVEEVVEIIDDYADTPSLTLVYQNSKV